MNTRIPLSLRNRRRITVLHRALLGALAAMALTACGGGGADLETPEVAQAPQGASVASTVTMTKVAFTNADGQALTGFLFQDSAATPRNAAVVMMHGCAGVWSNGVESKEAQPPIKALSHIHKRWGENLARAGYTGLLVDSFTPRALTNECNNGSAGLNEATVRPRDAAAGRAWLLANNHAAAGRVALLGWSHGASAVMATMDQTNEGPAGSKPFREAFAFYPGCGLINEFGGNASTPDKTTWLPYAPVTIHHAATDPLYTDGKCGNRVSVATTLGASSATGNAVAMTVHSAARHSFDQIDIAKAIASPYTTADRDAQIAADAAVLDRLATIFSN
ncbi:MAG: dienelactone hydrolase family protein [Ramlibacter sp.]